MIGSWDPNQTKGRRCCKRRVLEQIHFRFLDTRDIAEGLRVVCESGGDSKFEGVVAR